MVVAQLAERSLPTPEVHGSNPTSVKFQKFITVAYSRDGNKDKITGKGHFLH